MNFSKSHLDRLFKGSASLPSKRFVRVFLEITSSAAGVHPDRHAELRRAADELLSAAFRHRRGRRATEAVPKPEAPVCVAVTTLQAQLELERAHRASDGLRWALSDAQLLVSTLLHIIRALRDIITDLDTEYVRLLGTGADPGVTDSTAKQRLEARTHKAEAETQLARVNERHVLLDALWERARDDINRLSLHPGVADFGSLPAGPPVPPPELRPAALSAQPALADIALALRKAQEINATGESEIREWQQNFIPVTDLQPTDEHAVLIAATQLTDADNRRMALRTLVRQWAQSHETRDALVRLTLDEQLEIRISAIQGLTQAWPGDAAAREALIAVTCDHDPKARAVAVWGLTQGWSSDTVVRDALIALADDGSEAAREIAAEGLAKGWRGDVAARNTLLRLAHDSVQGVWETAIEVLTEGWPGDPAIRDTLLELLRSDEIARREVAAEGLGAHWPGDPIVQRGLNASLHDAAPTVRWAVQRGLGLALNPEGDPQTGFMGRGPQGGYGDPGLSGHQTSKPEQPAVLRGDSLLIAARIPRDFKTERPLQAVSALRRGIGFESGITVISGDNATGKTILLEALARRIGCLPKGEGRTMRGGRPLALDVAKSLDLLWHETLAPEECFYLGPDDPAHGSSILDKVLDKPLQYRLFLLDEPTSMTYWARESKRERAKGLYERMGHLTQQGCQFIISTTSRPADPRLIGAKRIRFSNRRVIDSLHAHYG
ncbi:HEAT repeat domain-containing protein [Embleya sp. NPDC059237]|uniref:HEAT repeat domain-containing protein n=1 Tax=Embleya sp. NPDC059237 TaxID=3346784 RepID=UPI0036857709